MMLGLIACPKLLLPARSGPAGLLKLVQLFAHGACGLPGEHMMKRLGMPVGDEHHFAAVERHGDALGTGWQV